MLVPLLCARRRAPAAAAPAAALFATPEAFMAPSRVPASESRCSYYVRAFGGTDVQYNCRVKVPVPKQVCDVSLVFGNMGANPSGTQTVRAGLETPAGTFPVFFRGQRSAVVEQYALVVSDPIGVDIAAGSVCFARVNVVPASGGTVSLSYTPIDPATEGVEIGAPTVTDKSLTGTIAYQFANAYAPLCLIGAGPKGVNPPTVAAFGDSILDDQSSYLQIALAGTRGLLSAAVAGSTALHFTRPYVGYYAASLYNLAASAKHVVCDHGTNDMQDGALTLATMQARLLEVWNTLADRGSKVWQCTITPQTTSSDGWATVGNQTIAGAARQLGGTLSQVNDWIRTRPAPLSGYFEVADAVMSGRNSNVWKAGYTNDGTHPNTTGMTAAATAINPAYFS